MKKILSVALIAAAFGLVGCSTQDKSDSGAYRDGKEYSKTKKGKKRSGGKLGAASSSQDQDMAK